jgi:hypothetical protein
MHGESPKSRKCGMSRHYRDLEKCSMAARSSGLETGLRFAPKSKQSFDNAGDNREASRAIKKKPHKSLYRSVGPGSARRMYVIGSNVETLFEIPEDVGSSWGCRTASANMSQPPRGSLRLILLICSRNEYLAKARAPAFLKSLEAKEGLEKSEWVSHTARLWQKPRKSNRNRCMRRKVVGGRDPGFSGIVGDNIAVRGLTHDTLYHEQTLFFYRHNS